MCENLLALKLLKFLYIGIEIIRYVVPILLIVKLTIDVYKNIINADGTYIKDMAFKRIIAAIVVFLAPTIINLFITIIENAENKKFDTPDCLSNLDNIKYYEELAEKKKELEDEERKRKEELLYAEYKRQQEESIQKASNNTLITDQRARYLGQKYNLSANELNGLCGVARAEQGSIEGAKAEASLMANLYELLTPNNRFYNKGLYNYVRDSGWFASASAHMNQGCPSDYIAAIRDVLVNGNRVLPFYVNEHDCLNCSVAHACSSGIKGDICQINTNGTTYNTINFIGNRNYYISNVTKVYTYYYKGGYWIFYSFPAKNSDPFGYTVEAKQAVDAMNK